MFHEIVCYVSIGLVKVILLFVLFMFSANYLKEDVKLFQAVRKDNKQRFSLLEENGELLIRANQGHTITVIYLSL